MIAGCVHHVSEHTRSGAPVGAMNVAEENARSGATVRADDHFAAVGKLQQLPERERRGGAGGQCRCRSIAREANLIDRARQRIGHGRDELPQGYLGSTADASNDEARVAVKASGVASPLEPKRSRIERGRNAVVLPCGWLLAEKQRVLGGDPCAVATGVRPARCREKRTGAVRGGKSRVGPEDIVVVV